MYNVVPMERGKKSLRKWLIAAGVIVLAAAIYLLFIRPLLMLAMATVGVELIAFFAMLLIFIVMLVMLIMVLLISLARALFAKNRDTNKVWFARLRRRALWSGIAAAMLAIMVVMSQWLAYTPPLRDAEGQQPVKGSVASLERVELNGSTQWISIRGQDTTNPVLLFLAGGRAGHNSPLCAINWAHWKSILS